MSTLTNKPVLEATPKGAISPPLRKTSTAPVFKPHFARSLRMHPVLAAVVAGLALMVVAGYALWLKPMYEAESLVYLEPGASRVLDDGSGSSFDSTRYDSYVQQQVQTASRLDILTAAVHSLPAGVWRGAGEPERSAATRLQHSLKIERVLNSYQLSFTLQGPDAEHTAETLNAVVAAYLKAGRKDELSTADQRTEILNEEKNRIETELASARAEQSTLSTSLGMANPGLESSNPYDSELSGLRVELASAREAHDVAAAQLASVSGSGLQGSQGLTAAADELIAGDAGLSSMKATVSQRRAVLSGQMAGLTPENPIYRQDAAELSNLDRSLEQMTTQVRTQAERRLQDKLRTDLSRTGDVEARLNGQLAQETGAATSASPRLQRASELTADIARLMKRYAMVDDALRGLALETSGPGTAHLSLAATTPSSPQPNRRKLLLLAALPLALSCGVFAAVFARKRDPRVYTGRDMEDLLGFTPIAVLPAGGEVAGGVMAEYVLRLAGGIEGAYRVSGARTFVLTPAGAGGNVDGLVQPLAMQLDKLGLRVTTVTAREVMTPALVPAAEAAGPDNRRREGVVARHLDGLLRRYDLLFIEAPALLTSAETEYLVRSADATILVAESGVTLRGELMQATLLLERLQVRGVGAVLDGLQLRFADAGFRRAVAELERREAAESKPRERVVSARAAQVRGKEQRQTARLDEPEAEVHAVEVPAGEEPLVQEDRAVAGEEQDGNESRPIPENIRDAVVRSDEPMIGEHVADDMVEREEFVTKIAPIAPIARIAPIAPQTGEDLPMGGVAETLPEETVASSEETEVAEAAPTRSRQMHRSVPLRRLAEAQEGEGSWLKRLLVHDADPPMSIVPGGDDQDEAAPVEEALAASVGRLPEALDLPLAPVEPPVATAAEAADSSEENAAAAVVLAEERGFAAGEEDVPAVKFVEQPLGEQSAEYPVAAMEAFASAMTDAERGAPVEGHAHVATASETLVPAGEIPIPDVEDLPQVVRVEEVPVEWAAAEQRELEPELEPAMAAPAPVATFAEASGAVPEELAVAEDTTADAGGPVAGTEKREVPAPWSAADAVLQHALDIVLELAPDAAVNPVADAVFQPVSQVPRSLLDPAPASSVLRGREPLRTGRWEAAELPSRVEISPWRDRRTSGSNNIYKSPERRFNWNTVDATPSGSGWPVAPVQVGAGRGASGPRLPDGARGGSERGLPERAADGLAERRVERPRPVPSEEKPVAEERPSGAGRLTRQWGLLSRFNGPEAPAGERQGGEFGGDSGRGSLRGRRRG